MHFNEDEHSTNFDICSVFVNMVYVICCTADPEGIAAAQKSMGIGQQDRDRRVR